MKENKVKIEEPKIQKETAEVKKEEVSFEPSFKDLAKAKLNKLREADMKMVKGRFRNLETPGGTAYVAFRKYKELPGDPPYSKNMLDGEVYEVPLYLANHINGIDKNAEAIGGKVNSCAYPTHGFNWRGNNAPGNEMGIDGIPVPLIGVHKMNRRFTFEPLEFAVA